MNSREGVFTDRSSVERVILVLTMLGVCASIVALLSTINDIKNQFAPGQLYSTVIYKGTIYHVAHAAEMLFIGSAGLIAMFSTDFRAIERGYLMRLGLLFGAATLMALRGYTVSDLFSTRIFDSTGPLAFFITIVAFIGARRQNWDVLGKMMVILAALFSVAVLMGIVSLRSLDRADAVVTVGALLNALYWPASWLVLSDYPRGSLMRKLHLIPIVVYSFGSFFTQTRLNFVMLFALLFVYAYVQHKRKEPQALGWIVGISLCVWLSLFTAVFLTETRAFEKLESVADAFSGRIEEDTRSGQWRWFHETVPPQDLLLGRGSFASWNWAGTEWSGGTDFGFLTMLLFGGLPLLLAYFATVLYPGWSALLGNPGKLRLVAGSIIALWTLRMTSSQYPGAGIEYYIVLFCVGACISREAAPVVRAQPYKSNVARPGRVDANPLVCK